MQLIKIGVVIFLGVFFASAHALKSDSEQAVTIDSDAASFDDEAQQVTYTGGVVTRQGSLHISSDKLVVYFNQGKIDKMIFTGKPTTFKQLPSAGKEYIHGEGLTGEYYPKQHKLILIEQAVVYQGGNRSSSRRIVYDGKNSLITAGNKSSERARVHSVFSPKVATKQASPKQTSNPPTAPIQTTTEPE